MAHDLNPDTLMKENCIVASDNVFVYIIASCCVQEAEKYNSGIVDDLRQMKYLSEASQLVLIVIIIIIIIIIQ